MPRAKAEPQAGAAAAAAPPSSQKKKRSKDEDEEEEDQGGAAAAGADSKKNVADLVRFFVFKNSKHECFSHQHIKDKLKISGPAYKAAFAAAREMLKDIFGFVVEELASQDAAEREADQFTAQSQAMLMEEDVPPTQPSQGGAGAAAEGAKGKSSGYFVVRSVFRDPKQRELMNWSYGAPQQGLLLAVVMYLFTNHPKDVKEDQLWAMLENLGIMRGSNGKGAVHPVLGNVQDLLDDFVHKRYISKKTVTAAVQDRADRVYRVGPRAMLEFPVMPLLRGIYGDGTVTLDDTH